MDDILLQARIKNNPLYQAISSYGYKSIKVFCEVRLCNSADYHGVLQLINFRNKPYSSVEFENEKVKRVCWTPLAERLSTALKMKESDLFNPVMYESVIDPVVEKEMSLDDVGVYLAHEETRLLKDHNPIEDAKKTEDATTIIKMLEFLSPREKQIIEMRFGLVDGIGRTLEEVGKEFHVTRERIRGIEQKVFEKIKKHPYAKKFNFFNQSQ